ncbi:MAG: hypothetical protein AMXMBFR13_44100 [Phycisphaerae bacterium]
MRIGILRGCMGALIVVSAFMLGQGCPPQFESQLNTNAALQFLCTKECTSLATAEYYTLYAQDSATAGARVFDLTGYCDRGSTTIICVPSGTTEVPPGAIDLDVRIEGVQ